MLDENVFKPLQRWTIEGTRSSDACCGEQHYGPRAPGQVTSLVRSSAVWMDMDDERVDGTFSFPAKLSPYDLASVFLDGQDLHAVLDPPRKCPTFVQNWLNIDANLAR